MQEALRDWEEAVRSTSKDGSLRDVILRSWARSEGAGVHADPDALTVPRISEKELRQRTRENELLLEVVSEHLAWVTNALSTVPHVVYFTDPDGIVLASEGTDREMMEAFALSPGHDWSETAMGTNGAGTCLVTGRPVVVFGEEHYVTPLKGFVCTAAPIRDHRGHVMGAIDLSTANADGRPQNLVIAAQAAFAVEREYAWRKMSEPTTASGASGRPSVP